MDSIFHSLLACDRNSLMEFVLDIELRASSENERLALLYAKILNSYYQSDIPQLKKLYKKLNELKELSEDHQILTKISYLRLQIRKGEITNENISALSELPISSVLWSGEVHFVCGFALSRLGEHYKARTEFLLSSNAFKDAGINKKAVLALQNYITAESHLHPQKNMIPERLMVLKKAMEAGASDVAGLTTLDLSMDYEAIGAMELSLENARRAVDLLGSHQQTYQHGCALTHLCRICYKMNLLKEGEQLYFQLKGYSIAEIRANVKMVEQLRSNKGQFESNSNSMPWWENHFKKNNKKVTLGKLGEKLLVYLASGPKEKQDIVAHLYGTEISYESLENRFHVLLSRLRKKAPDLIVFQDDGKYSLRPVDIGECR